MRSSLLKELWFNILCMVILLIGIFVLIIGLEFIEGMSIWQYIFISLLATALIMLVIHTNASNEEKMRQRVERRRRYSFTNQINIDPHSRFRRPNPILPESEEPKKFNIIFADKHDSYYTRGLPPCLLCRHNHACVEFDADGNPTDTFTRCELGVEYDATWSEGEFSLNPLKEINDYPLGVHDDDYYFEDCKEFIPNFHVWNEQKAIKNGEYEIIWNIEKTERKE